MNKQIAKSNPFVTDTKKVYVVLSLSNDYNKQMWQGPFETKEQAQRAAARWLIERNWMSCSVFELVGTAAKQTPDIDWHETGED